MCACDTARNNKIEFKHTPSTYVHAVPVKIIATQNLKTIDMRYNYYIPCYGKLMIHMIVSIIYFIAVSNYMFVNHFY